MKIAIALIFTVISADVVLSRPQQRKSAEEENLVHVFYFPTPEEQVEIRWNDSRSLQEANLKPATKTLFLIDGFTAPPFTPFYHDTKNVYSGRDDMNIITVDWSAYSAYGKPIESEEQALELYFETILFEIPKAAEDLAEIIHFMVQDDGIRYEDVVLVGHSLGSHTAGATGRTLMANYNASAARIIGLDPSIQISEVDAPMRLRVGDADFVEIYKTNREWAGDIYHAVGDVSIFVNGGDYQPCPFNGNYGKAAELFCDSHGFSWKLYNYLAGNATLKACPCRGAACTCYGCEFECGSSGISIGPHIPQNARGSFHVKTGTIPW